MKKLLLSACLSYLSVMLLAQLEHSFENQFKTSGKEGSASTQAFTLQNVAASAGLAFKQNNFATDKKYPFETLGGAVAMLDYDNDGALDLLFLNGSPSPEHLKSDPQSWNRL